MNQQTLFNRIENSTIHVHHAAETAGESITTPTTVKLTDSQKQQIQKFCFEHDLSVSEFIRAASCFYHDWYELAPKLTRYREAVLGMLKPLP